MQLQPSNSAWPKSGVAVSLISNGSTFIHCFRISVHIFLNSLRKLNLFLLCCSLHFKDHWSVLLSPVYLLPFKGHTLCFQTISLVLLRSKHEASIQFFLFLGMSCSCQRNPLVRWCARRDMASVQGSRTLLPDV